MHLYNLTLEKTGAITCACYGSFSAPKQQEIVVGRGQYIEIFKVNPVMQTFQTIAIHDIFGVVRAVMPFRLHGATKDYLMVGSDSGRIVILDFDAAKGQWNKVHQETYGKSGCRRSVPGQYLAVDPRGRTMMISAIEKQKFVYILNRDNEAKITISSPLEAHKSNTVTFATVGVDVGFENPVFAALEVDHSELDEDPSVEKADKQLVFYELDLGLNHVVRKWDTLVDDTANLLVQVPGGDDGPGGVLVCSENYVTYLNMGHDPVKQVIPRRQDMLPENGLMIVSSSLHKQKNVYFFLFQSEYGDLYKVTLDVSAEKDEVHQIHIKYFDTVPVANSIVIMRSGYLFVASEFGNHKLYEFQGVGDDDDDAIIGVMTIAEEGAGEDEQEILPLFNPRELKNLHLVDERESLAPIIDSKVMDLADDEGRKIFTLCGRGPGSSIRMLQHGLSLSELAVCELPGVPEKVWTVRKQFNSQYDSYIIVSFNNATLVLSIGDTVEEVSDSGFWGSTSTLVCKTLQDDSLLQVHSSGLRHIRKDRRINEWKAPGKKQIMKAAANHKQVVIAMSGGELVYFELDQYGSLNEVNKKDLEKEVACLAIGPIPEERVRSRFLAIGFYDKRVHLVSLDPEENLHTLARQSCNSEPEDIRIIHMESETQEKDELTCMYIGLGNGIVVRSTLDSITGEISDTRTRFCGTRPCKLVTVQANEKEAVLVLSSRSWLGYYHQNKYNLQPLSTDPFDYAASFSSKQCQEGLVTIRGDQVRILALERLSDCFNQKTTWLKATPRAFVRHPLYPYFIIIETDHRAYTDEEKQSIRKNLKASIMDEDDEEAMKDIEETEGLPEKDYGTIRAPLGRWCSYIRIWDPAAQQTHDLIELEDNQAAFSLTTVVFHNSGGEVHLVVGTAKDLIPNPRTCNSGLLLTFRFRNEGRELDLVHKTVIDGIPYAMHPFQGRLLVGVNNLLRIYDLGKRKLLRKCENKQIPNFVSRIVSYGSRVFVGDATDSVFCVRYKKADNSLAIFADDTLPRWISGLSALDYNTIAVGDKFGNISVLRLAEGVSEEMDNDPNCAPGSMKWLRDRGFLNGAPQKLGLVASFHVGSAITSLDKVTLTAGGMEVIMYTTIMGSIGVLLPITNRDDVDLLTILEMHLRQENPPLCGRDHMAYRSAFVPVKEVVDGDFVEQYSTLPAGVQQSIANELNRTPNDICKRLEEIRNKIL